MGQEVGVTPLQMVAAFGALANKGVRVSPHLVREIRSSSGAVVYRPKIEERQVISENTATQLKGMLEGVTLNGTAKKAQLNGYTAAGKTGTAQKIDPRTKTYSTTKYVGSFVGFAPIDNPSVVIIVVVDEPAGAYHGGDVAAPVFRDIAEQVLPELGTLPDTEIKLPPGQVAQLSQTPEENEKQREEDTKQEEARAASMPTVSAGDGNGQEIIYANATSKAILMPDMHGRSVRDVARTCALLGLQLEAHGDGRVTRQSPAAGTEVDAGQVVQVQFGKGH
jgi:membrane peptidoglycan carboxypeptidase